MLASVVRGSLFPPARSPDPSRHRAPPEAVAPRTRAKAAEKTASTESLTEPLPPVDVSRRLASSRLQNIDGMVRAHEQAHLSAIATYAQGPVQYSYLIGPDGQRYAVGGSISVNLQPVPGDPAATLRKARALLRSAYSPATPSGADMRVAAAAYRLEMDAKRAIAREKAAEQEGDAVSLFV